MSESTDVLIVAAFAPELEPLRALLGDGLTGSVGGARVAASAVGIGLARASAGIARALDRVRPRALVLLGSCGAYPGRGLAIGDALVARSVALIEPAALAGDAGYPAVMPVRAEADIALVAGLAGAGARAVDVANTLAITTGHELAEALARTSGADAEHMEAFALAAAQDPSSPPVRFTAVLGVANVCGPRARDEWREHARAAHAAATGVLVAWLTGGAAGLAGGAAGLAGE